MSCGVCKEGKRDAIEFESVPFFRRSNGHRQAQELGASSRTLVQQTD